MPDYSVKITSKSDYDRLVNDPNDIDINKVILFSKKEQVSPVFKAIVAEFKNRLRFFYIYVPENISNKDIINLQFENNAQELPHLIIIESS